MALFESSEMETFFFLAYSFFQFLRRTITKRILTTNYVLPVVFF